MITAITTSADTVSIATVVLRGDEERHTFDRMWNSRLPRSGVKLHPD